jgi:hypothetical protein
MRERELSRIVSAVPAGAEIPSRQLPRGDVEPGAAPQEGCVNILGSIICRLKSRHRWAEWRRLSQIRIRFCDRCRAIERESLSDGSREPFELTKRREGR